MTVSWRWAVGAALLYAAAVILLTWPLFRHPGTTVLDTPSLYGPAAILIQRDINLTLWILAWGARALVTDPLHFFDANAFYPAPASLALSEHMLGNQPFFAPVYWATANPVLGHQATLLATFVVAGLAMAAYVLYWTGDNPSAVVAGLLYALAPFRLWQLGNLHVISIHWLPLVPLAVDATLDGHDRAGPVGLAAALLLSTFCSFYVGYAAFLLAAVYAACGVATRGRASFRRLVPAALAVASAAIVVGAISLPYARLQHLHVLPDYSEGAFASLAFLGMLSIGLGGLLRFYVLPLREGIPEFLTVTALVLAAMAVLARRRHPRGALLAVASVGLVLSLGPFLYTRWGQIALPYAWLARILPGFSAMRVPQRFGALVTFSVAALAGLGLAWLRGALAGRGLRTLAALAAAVVVLTFALEVRPGGLRARWMPVGDAFAPAYHWLAVNGAGGPLLELPAGVEDFERQSNYLYASTAHWLPLVNGYTPYPPRSFVELMTAALQLPQPEALDTILARVRLKWVLLHVDGVLPGMRPAWEKTLGARLRRVAEFPGAIIFEVPQDAPSPSPG